MDLTYTLANGAVWVNSDLGNSGDIITSQVGTKGILATAYVAQTLDTCTVSPSATGISFTNVASGASSPTAANPYPVSVQNTGNVNGELFVSGTPWFLGTYSGTGAGQNQCGSNAVGHESRPICKHLAPTAANYIATRHRIKYSAFCICGPILPAARSCHSAIGNLRTDNNPGNELLKVEMTLVVGFSHYLFLFLY